ncbi:hypothetical protein IBTHAUMO2_20005 [Nitrosopumilaceae archaeon]|nr:tetratricopeptide repeat protein [Nitrosopumilus sp.]CAI9831194.1 hypothetical protein IBTHAUMO2_20005 [Nitrosopumilaceae archaeon]
MGLFKRMRDRMGMDPNNNKAEELLASMMAARSNVTASPKQKEALAYYDKILMSNPNNVEALANKGGLLNALERLEEALECFERALEIKPDDHIVLDGMGYTLFDLGKYKEAVKHYIRSLNIKPSEPAIINRLAMALIRLGMHKDAVEYCEIALKLAPGDSFIKLHLDAANLALEDGPEIQKLSGVADMTTDEKNSISIDILLLKADYMFMMSDYEASLKCINDLLEIDPDNVDALHKAGSTLSERLGKHNEGIKFCDRALKIKQDHVPALICKANTLHILSEYEESLVCYTLAEKADPTTPNQFSAASLVLHDLGRFEEAVEHADRALTINPNYTKALCNKGLALGKLGRTKEALACYERSLEIESDDLIVLGNKAAELCDIKEYRDAMKCVDKMLEIDPNDARGLKLKNTLQYEKSYNQSHLDAVIKKGNEVYADGKYEEALACYDEELRLEPNSTRCLKSRARALYELHRYEESLGCWTNALVADPDDGDALKGRGLVLGSLGMHKQALACFDRVLEMNPGDSDALARRESLLKDHGRD